MGEKEYMITEEVAALSRVPVETARYWRTVGKGPRWFRVGGRRVLYARTDVEAWLESAREGAA